MLNLSKFKGDLTFVFFIGLAKDFHIIPRVNRVLVEDDFADNDDLRFGDDEWEEVDFDERQPRRSYSTIVRGASTRSELDRET